MHFKFFALSCLAGSVTATHPTRSNYSLYPDEEFYETSWREYGFSPDPRTARSEVARLVLSVADGSGDAKNNLWERIGGSAFVARAVESNKDDLLKAAALLVGDLSVLGVAMTEFNPNPLCDRIQPQLYLPTNEMDFARKVMGATEAQKLQVWTYTPFANFDRVGCSQPFSLDFRAKMMREQIVRQWAILDSTSRLRLPKVFSNAKFASLVGLIYSTEPYDLVTQFDLAYKDKHAKGVSVVRDMLGRFFKMVHKVPIAGSTKDDHAIYSIARHEDSKGFIIFHELRAVGRALGLSVLYNIPVGFSIDPELLDYLMTTIQPVKFVEPDYWLLKKGFKDIIPQIEMGRYVSVAEFGRILLGQPDTALTIPALRQCVAGLDHAIIEEEIGARFVRYEPQTEYTSNQRIIIENLFEHLESHQPVADFIRQVTGQHVVPFGALRMCPSMQIVFVPCQNDLDCDIAPPIAHLMYNRFFLLEYTSKEVLMQHMDRFFE